MEHIKINRLTKIYGEDNSQIHALNEIELIINRLEYVVYMGPSGAGKSTLIHLLAGLDSPSGGDIYINDKNLTSMSDNKKCDLRREEIGIVFQFFNLNPHLTVSENIELPQIIANIPKGKRKPQIDRVLKLLDIEKRKNHYPFELSGGERQRTAIARALVMGPSLLLADEPTGDLDFESGSRIIDILHQLNKDENLTVIQVTHDEIMLRPGDRLINMEDGKIISDQILNNSDL